MLLSSPSKYEKVSVPVNPVSKAEELYTRETELLDPVAVAERETYWVR